MMLEDAKQHMEEMLKILSHPKATIIMNKDYMKVLNDFNDRFKHWQPNIYIYVEGGNIQGASADCDVSFNLFDDDNEKERTELEPGEEPYQERKDMWNWMIDSGFKDGSLKTIY